jgi:hypothetical protein
LSGIGALNLGLDATVGAGTHRIAVRLKGTISSLKARARLLNSSNVEQGVSTYQTITTTAATYAFSITSTGNATRAELQFDVADINFAWDANAAGDNVTDYKLYYRTAVFDVGTQAWVGTGSYGSAVSLGIADTIHTITHPGVVRSYAITAVNANGESDFSNEVIR